MSTTLFENQVKTPMRQTSILFAMLILAACPRSPVKEAVDGGSDPTPEADTPLDLPDPATVAPALDQTVDTQMGTATAFLYTGSNPTQTGVPPGTIDARRVAVIRGLVRGSDGAPLQRVKVTVTTHPEFGQTWSRTDGAFDLAVNGGSTLNLRYEHDGFIPIQRQVQAPWRDYVIAPEAIMTAYDSQVTPIVLTGATGFQVARGNPVTDSDGPRQATILFPPGTSASMVLPDGSSRPLETLHVRATEFTVGPSGPAKMPAPLPPGSGYTYAIELSTDEAIAARADSVNFSQPLSIYVENFLNFPVGMPVPAGYFDRKKGVWIPSDNGRVIKILGKNGKIAELAVTRAGTPATPAELQELGIADPERNELAERYEPGQTLWRIPVEHFTPWDFNWPYGVGPNDQPPRQRKPLPGNNAQDKPSYQCGSVIECQNEVLGERLPIGGTPFIIHYSSSRTRGYRAARTLEIPLSDATPPANVKRIDLTVEVAGRDFRQSFLPQKDLKYVFNWDGRDAYGRLVSGRQPATVTIGYVYNAVYQEPTTFTRSFATFSGAPIANPSRQEVTLEQIFQVWIQLETPQELSELGGWSFDVHHRYDVAGGVLRMGNTTRRSTQTLGNVMHLVAGNGVEGDNGDNTPATDSELSNPPRAQVDGSGNIFVAQPRRVRKIDTNGIITTVAGNGKSDFGTDDGPATQQSLQPSAIAIGPNGDLFVSDNQQDFGNGRVSKVRIRRVGADGIITTFAGNGLRGFSGDGGPATAATIDPGPLAFDQAGNLFFIDGHIRIRKISPDGTISTAAGNGARTFSGDGGPATAAGMDPRDLAIDNAGNIFISDAQNRRIRKLGTDGIITTVAGDGLSGAALDGNLATKTSLNSFAFMALDKFGNLYVADSCYTFRVLKIGSDGLLSAVAGRPRTEGPGPCRGDPPALPPLTNGGPAFADFGAGILGVDELGNLLFSYSNQIWRISAALPSSSAGQLTIPSASGVELYVFNSEGRHLRTIDALSGAKLLGFTYSATGTLTQIEDGSGNKTTIQRDANGLSTSITAPDGQTTSLGLDENGYLKTIANPAGEAFHLVYASTGLLTRLEDPRGNVTTMTYDGEGQLASEVNATDGGWTLSRDQSGAGSITHMTSALGRTYGYQIEELLTGGQRRTNTKPDGTTTSFLILQNGGTETTTTSDGTIARRTEAPDPRFGMLSPITSQVVVSTPGGLVSTMEVTRTTKLTNPLEPLSLVTSTDATTANGRTFTTDYDASVKQFTSTSAAGRGIVVRIDDLGRMTYGQTAGLEGVSLSYDSRGRLSTVAQGSGNEQRAVSVTYDPQGNPASVTDSLGRVSTYEYDLAGRLTKQTRPDGECILLSYDASSNISSVTPAGKLAHSISYTPTDQWQMYMPPTILGEGMGTTTYSYNADKQVTQIVRPDGKVLAFGYEAGGGRLLTTTTPSGVTSYGYAPTTGKLTSITAPGGVGLAYTHDGFLPLTESWTGPVTGSVAHMYNNDFQVTSLSVNGTPITFGYDKDLLLTQAGALTINRRADNGLVSGTTLGTTTTTQSYNLFGESAGVSAAAGSNTLFSFTYARDRLGRMTTKTETIQGSSTVFDYGYDLAGRLTSVSVNGGWATQYQYDGNGNRTGIIRPVPLAGIIASYDAQDRLTSYADISYTYTANGELLSKAVGTDITRYEHDVVGNLRKVTLPDSTRIEYVIDGRNRRIGKKVDDILVQGFLYQGQVAPAAELDGAGNIVARFVYGLRPNMPEYMIKADTTYRIFSDHLGSPRLVVNTATGAIAQRMDFDEFGITIGDTNPGFQPFGFAGGLYDQQTGFMRFGARDYDPHVGRWTKKDGSRFRGGLNFYAYVDNDPQNHIDPRGRMKLPADPSGLGPEWTMDPTNRDPNGSLWRHPDGDTLEFNKGRPGLPGWRGKDHWHHNGDHSKAGHKRPGDEVPDPEPVCSDSQPDTAPAADPLDGVADEIELSEPSPEAIPVLLVPILVDILTDVWPILLAL